MWFAIGIAVLIVGCWLLTGLWLALAATFDALLGGLLAVLGLFITGNVANKYVVAKSLSGVSFQGEVPTGGSAAVAKKLVAKKDDGAPENGEGG